MKFRLLAASMTAALAGSAVAQNFEVAMVSDYFSNGIVIPMGSSIPVNTSETYTYTHPFNTPSHFLTFDVIATNTGGTDFDLALTNLEFRTPVPTPGSGQLPNGEIVRLYLTADFDSVSGSYNAESKVDGTMTFTGGQSAFVEKASIHQTTPLWAIGANRTTTGTFSAGPVNALSIPATTTYTIWTEYVFGIIDGTSGGYGSIELPSSGHDRGSLVPAPATLALLAAAGTLAARRRRV